MSTQTKTKAFSSFLAAILIAVSTVVFAPEYAEAAGPCKVTSYSLHARIRLAERDYSKAEIERSVKVNCSKGRWQSSKGTWLYPAQSCSGLPTVVLNPQGVVVTFYAPTGFDGGGGCGGGGGGSYRVLPVPTSQTIKP